MKKANAVLCLLLALTVVCVSCKKDDDNENPPTPVEEISESNLRTYIFASCNNDDLATVSGRFTNQVNQLESDNTDVVIITPNEFNSLTDSQWTEIREVLLNDGAVVFLSPTDQDLKDFSETAVNNWDIFGNGDFSYFDIISRLEYLGDMSADDSKTDTRYRAIGFCSNNILILPNKDIFNTDCMSINYDAETHEMTDSTYYPSVGETIEYSVKDELDDIVDWANRSVNEARSLANAPPIPTDITKMGTLLEVPLNFTFTSDYLARFCPPGLMNNISRVLETGLYCRVWSVYDLDNSQDNYLFHQELQFQGSRLDPQPSNPDQWMQDANGRWRYYGPFLESFNSETQFSDPNCHVLNVIPANTITNTNYTSGHMWNVNCGLSISANPGLNIGGSLTIQESKTTQIADLGTVVNFRQDNVLFKYKANVLPIGHFAAGHDIAKDCLHSDLNPSQSWIYRINTQPQDYSKYHLNISFWVWPTFLYSWDAFLVAGNQYKTLGIGWDKVIRNLPAPQRAVQEWRMFCNEAPVGSPLQQFLTQCYENYFYNSPFKIGDATRESRKSIDLFIKDFETRLRNDVDLWKNNNFYGTYHFTWQIDGNTYHTTEFTVNRD